MFMVISEETACNATVQAMRFLARVVSAKDIQRLR